MQTAKNRSHLLLFSEWVGEIKSFQQDSIRLEILCGVKDFHADFTTGSGRSCEFATFLLSTSIVFLWKHG